MRMIRIRAGLPCKWRASAELRAGVVIVSPVSLSPYKQYSRKTPGSQQFFSHINLVFYAKKE